jgi:hypothetical protein
VARVVQGQQREVAVFCVEHVDGAGVLPDAPKPIEPKACDPQQDDPVKDQVSNQDQRVARMAGSQLLPPPWHAC